jgi:hypothetical protein
VPNRGYALFGVALGNKGYLNGKAVHGNRYRNGIRLKPEWLAPDDS